MAKHVFQISSECMSHRGEYVDETEHFIKIKRNGRGKEIRESRTSHYGRLVVIETDDPDATERAWRVEFGAHAEAVRAASKALLDAKSARLDAANAAAGWKPDDV